MADYWSKFYSGGMSPSVPFIPEPGSLGYVPPAPSGELTSRSVKTFKVDPYTGQPVAANPTYQQGMLGRGQPARLSTASAAAAADRLAGGEGQKRIRLADGRYVELTNQPVSPFAYAGPFAQAALTTQQKAKPVEITVTGGNRSLGRKIQPSWANPPGFGSDMIPVQNASPELVTEYEKFKAGQPNNYAGLLADQAQVGNIGKTPVKGGGLASLLNPGKGTPRAATSNGGLFSLLFNGGATPTRASTATGTSTNGYVYSNGQRTGVAPQYAGMSPSKMYDAINAAAGNRTSSGTRSSFDDNQEMGRANYSLASSRN